jgi:G2/mitotic-specific cyclin-B, other
MDQQPEIKWHMRPCLVDFLVEVHFTFRLRPETLYLALNIVDRYVSRRVVYVKHYQLVGCTALWIAAKFEDAKERVPTVQDLAQICNDTYDESAFTQMEVHVLNTIQWSLGHPTAEAWLRFMCCGSRVEDPKVQHVARFLMEITLFYREFVKYPPSAIAHGALTLARYLCELGRQPHEETDECIEIAEHLDDRLARCVNELSEVLVKKYSYAFYSKAATFVVEYYLKGGRFIRLAPPQLPIPVTPTRTPLSSVASTPASVATTASDLSEDMPSTPMTPTSPLSSDVYSGSSYPSEGYYDKENMPSVTTFSPVVSKHHTDTVPDQFLPHDFVSFGRPALHSLNVSSPRVTAVS